MKKCLAIACERNYLPGLVVLLNSLKLNGKVPWGSVDIVVISSDLEEFQGTTIWPVDIRDYSAVARNRYAKAWYKLEAMRLPYEHVVLMDADLLCLGDVSQLFSETEFDLTVAPDHGIELAPVYKNSFVRFNSGVCVLTRKMLQSDTWKQLIDLGGSGKSYDGGDQGAMNELAMRRDDITMDSLDSKYNALKRLYKHQPKFWKRLEADVRLLHFVGRKPWDRNGERGYEELEKKWKQYS